MDPVDLNVQPHVVTRWWIRGQPASPDHGVIGLGTLDAGWFVAKAESGHNRAWAVPTERDACEQVARWIHRSQPELWQEHQPGAVGH